MRVHRALVNFLRDEGARSAFTWGVLGASVITVLVKLPRILYALLHVFGYYFPPGPRWTRERPRRKLLMGMWDRPVDSHLYGKISVPYEPAKRYIEKLRSNSDVRVTILTLATRAIGLALQEIPELNGRIVFDRFVPFKTVDISYLAEFDGGKNVGFFKCRDVPSKTPLEIAQELADKTARLRQRKLNDYEKTDANLRLFPTWLVGPLQKLTTFFASDIGLSMPLFGIKRFPFGTCMITSVGRWDLDDGYAPIPPGTRCPIICLLLRARKVPVVAEDSQIVVREMVPLSFSVDHRYIDGFQAQIIYSTLKTYFADPESFENKLAASSGRSSGKDKDE